MNMSIHSTRNQTVRQDGQKPTTKAAKAKQYGGAVTRLATMPVGTVKDLMQGGIIQAGKNFIPRLRNVVTGTTLTNRAEIVPKKAPADTTAEATEKGKKVAEDVTSDTSSDRGTDTGGTTTDTSSTRKEETDSSEDNPEEHEG